MPLRLSRIPITDFLSGPGRDALQRRSARQSSKIWVDRGLPFGVAGCPLVRLDSAERTDDRDGSQRENENARRSGRAFGTRQQSLGRDRDSDNSHRGKIHYAEKHQGRHETRTAERAAQAQAQAIPPGGPETVRECPIAGVDAALSKQIHFPRSQLSRARQEKHNSCSEGNGARESVPTHHGSGEKCTERIDRRPNGGPDYEVSDAEEQREPNAVRLSSPASPVESLSVP